MEKDYFRYFRYLLLKVSNGTNNQVIDIRRVLFEIEISIGLFNLGKTIEFRIEEIVMQMKKMSGHNQDTVHFIQNSVLNLIDEKLQYYIEFYPALSKASQEMLDEGNLGEEYWLSSWPHYKILNKEEYFESIKICKAIWEQETGALRNALKVLIFKPPYIELNKYFEVLSL